MTQKIEATSSANLKDILRIIDRILMDVVHGNFRN